MTQEQQRAAIKAMMERHTAKVTVDRQTAINSLVADGVYTPEGELTPQFGGPEKKSPQAR
jgi:hypothetical protein